MICCLFRSLELPLPNACCTFVELVLLVPVTATAPHAGRSMHLNNNQDVADENLSAWESAHHELLVMQVQYCMPFTKEGNTVDTSTSL